MANLTKQRMIIGLQDELRLLKDRLEGVLLRSDINLNDLFKKEREYADLMKASKEFFIRTSDYMQARSELMVASNHLVKLLEVPGPLQSENGQSMTKKAD